MPTIMVIFVQSTFVLATFVHIRNISDVTESIFTKNFCIQNLLDPKSFWTQIFSEPTFFWGTKFFSHQNFFGPKIFLTPQIFSNPKLFSDSKSYLTQNELQLLVYLSTFDRVSTLRTKLPCTVYRVSSKTHSAFVF